MTPKSYLGRCATSSSQTVNVVVLNGLPDETVSGRAYRKGQLEGIRKWRVLQNFIDFIFFWENEHCKASHLYDKEYALLILSYYYDISKLPTLPSDKICNTDECSKQSRNP